MILFRLTKGLWDEPASRRAGALHAAAVRATQREELQLTDGLDLTLTQFTVMHPLDSADGELSTSELARQPGLSAGTTSRAIDALVRAGIVDRREGDGDRRMKSLQLTEAGLDSVQPVWPTRRDGLAQLAGLTPAQHDALSAALQPLLANAPLHPARRREEPGDDHSDAMAPGRALDQALLVVPLGLGAAAIIMPVVARFSDRTGPGKSRPARPGATRGQQPQPPTAQEKTVVADIHGRSRPFFCTGYRSDGSEGSCHDDRRP